MRIPSSKRIIASRFSLMTATPACVNDLSPFYIHCTRVRPCLYIHKHILGSCSSGFNTIFVS